MNKTKSLRLALGQYNFTVGDLHGNADKVIHGIRQAVQSDCDMIIFPELCLTGYPPEDLLLRRQFIHDQKKFLQEITGQVGEITCLLGFVDEDRNNLYNAAAIIRNHKIWAVYHKIHLPNYSVFDEQRYFKAGNEPLIIVQNDVCIGISICEDIWIENSVVEMEALTGNAEILVNLSASPYYMGKLKERERLIQARARRCCSYIAYTNLVGGQDELVFDGQSMIVDQNGQIIRQCPGFIEDMICCDIDVNTIHGCREQNISFQMEAVHYRSSFPALKTVTIPTGRQAIKSPLITPAEPKKLTDAEEVYNALILGLRDYAYKNGFKQVVFGLSGGIDSALVAVMAADALGGENVNCLSMPTRFSSRGSVDDAELLAKNAGVNFRLVNIDSMFESGLQLLKPVFAETPFGVTEENLQARIRGMVVMALSNKFGWLALTPGNKSEVSVGYCTLYGDMVGGFAPLKDVSKMWVYKLSRYRNELAGYDLIPQAIIDKAPSAELRPNQKDEDSLPPYPILDAILELYVQDEKSVDDIVKAGFDREIVKKVLRLVDSSEYKRRQAAPGVKITHRAFGKDRRMPLTNKYHAG
ncbi:MAG TPA: NAD+ synthase [bacterium]|nr:NAD+ synthase [bacterium]HPN42774.1 NAD+ synthase [bacterium]